jgi:lipopolysaccharide biosynthesis protein
MNIRGITHRITGHRGELIKPEPINDFYLDSPHSLHVGQRTVHVEGWLVTNPGFTVHAIKAINNGTPHVMRYGKVRADVSSTHPGSSPECGFESDFAYKDGELSIEVDFGEGFIAIHAVKISYSPEVMVDMLLNPNLAEYAADHENLLKAKKSYYYEPNSPDVYERKDDDAKLIALYLPQFHPLLVNDEVWGLGFTEWTNVTKAIPRFVGHEQPLLPGGLGFYDLRVEDTIKQQIDLAKSHGIYGFCFYYYWFSGTKILDTPIKTVLKHSEWDFHFAICWANENWTKRWDGRNDDIILSQEYHEGDPLAFITEVAPILNDQRYITKDGKPVLVVYRASELKNPKRYAKVWRDYFKKQFNKELYLVSSMGFEVNDPAEYGFDVGLDFSPQTNFFKTDIFEGGKIPSLNQKVHYFDPNFNGSIVKYADTALNEKLTGYFDFPTIDSIVPSWDNDARKNGAGFIMYGSNPDHYGKWLKRTLHKAFEVQGNSPLVFLNAWNEWAEGAVLEPTQSLGYAYLNQTSRTLSKHRQGSTGASVAVVIHISSRIDPMKLYAHLKPLIGIADIFITATAKYEDSLVKLRTSIPDAVTRIVPDRGRDIFPFFFVTGRLVHPYSQILKISLYGDKETQDRVIDELLGSKNEIQQIIDRLKSNNDAVIIVDNVSFWASAAYVSKVMQNQWVIEDFKPEVGQGDDDLVVGELRPLKSVLGISDYEDLNNEASIKK